jgi:hypothetical protein
MKKITHWFFATSLLVLTGVSVAQDEMAGVDPDDEVIILDTTDENRDPWSSLRDTSDDAEREPGLIQIGRMGRPGVRSFFGLPLALTQEDLQDHRHYVRQCGAPVAAAIHICMSVLPGSASLLPLTTAIHRSTY